MTSTKFNNEVQEFESESISNVIQLYCFNHLTNEETEPTILKDDFEEWLDKEGYLEGEGEDLIGSDHEGEPKYSNSKWSYSVDEILNFKSDWDVTELLTEFINK